MISVFTPSHRPTYLDECYDTLKQQTYEDWEWVVVLNQQAYWSAPPDHRVKVVVDESQGVGAAKARACAECTGDILFELDHDDLLASNALEAVQLTFEEYPNAALVYSHCAQILEDGSRDESMFDPACGWEYRDADVDGRNVKYAVSFQATPSNVSYIWFAPNHLRAFPAWAYNAAGGYDVTREVLDDQDLMSRLYLLGDFVLIDECLYLQRMHPDNTQRQADINPYIQTETVAIYDRTIEQAALAWARRSNLLALDLGAAHAAAEGYLGVDQFPAPGVTVVTELPTLPFADNTVGVIRAVDFLEHVTDKVALMNELYRVLSPGGMLLSMTPSTDGRGAFQDPTHIAFWNENSFWYYTYPQYMVYVHGLLCQFQFSRLLTSFPTPWHEQHNISYVTANLIAVKPGMDKCGAP